MADSHHSIKIVARRTGLTAHVIRIWEKRYGAVEPERTDTNRRLYSEEQIERLGLLRDLTQAGHSISHVAKLPLAKSIVEDFGDFDPAKPDDVNKFEMLASPTVSNEKPLGN